MVSAGIQSKELLCERAKNFYTTSYLLGLSIKQPICSPVIALVWHVKLIWVVQCFGFKNQRLGHCVDVSRTYNDLGLVCRAYLGGSRLRIQEPWIGALQCGGLLIMV